MRGLFFACVVACALTGVVAVAGPAVRTADQRQALVDLAYVLGQAHALRRACAGPADDTWRARMEKLLDVEAPAEALRVQLADSFNAGYASGGAEARDCKTAAAAEARAARRGSDLARRLSAGTP